jgi:hypothetical protein
MAEGRLEALIPKLIERTRAGKVGWTHLPTEGDSAYFHALPDGAGSLVVRRQYSTFQLTLRNANGEQLESVGELQRVAEVAALWRIVDARGGPGADTYSALQKDLQS